MNTMDTFLDQIGKQNREAEKKRPKPAKAEVDKMAGYLRNWSKGKPIHRDSADHTFWTCGQYSTKIDFKMANALVAAGHATISGNSTDAGATLTMKR